MHIFNVRVLFHIFLVSMTLYAMYPVINCSSTTPIYEDLQLSQFISVQETICSTSSYYGIQKEISSKMYSFACYVCIYIYTDININSIL